MQPGFFRVITGQRLRLHTVSSVAVTIRAFARVLYDNGETSQLTMPALDLAAGGLIDVEQDHVGTDVVLRDGWCVYASIEMVTLGIFRGQTFARLSLADAGAVLVQDYVHQNYSPQLGVFRDSGPGGGSGFLEIQTVKAESVPVSQTVFTYAVTNRIRKVLGFTWYYNCSANVASRIINVQLRAPLGAVPSGFAFAGRTFQAGPLTLTAGEEGALWGDIHRHGESTDNIITIANQASNPSPFPYLVADIDPAGLFFLVTAEDVDDRDVIYVEVENWVVM